MIVLTVMVTSNSFDGVKDIFTERQELLLDGRGLKGTKFKELRKKRSCKFDSKFGQIFVMRESLTCICACASACVHACGYL